MKVFHGLTALVAVSALTACCYRPCPRPMPPVAPSYCAPACAPIAVAPARPVRVAPAAPIHHAPVAKERAAIQEEVIEK